MSDIYATRGYGAAEIGFGEIDKALERMESRQVFGKIVMRMD